MARRKPTAQEDADEVLRLAAGRRFIMRWLTDMQLDADVFHTDPLIMARNTGLKCAGLALQRELRQDHPELYALMVREHDNKKEDVDIQDTHG